MMLVDDVGEDVERSILELEHARDVSLSMSKHAPRRGIALREACNAVTYSGNRFDYCARKGLVGTKWCPAWRRSKVVAARVND